MPDMTVAQAAKWAGKGKPAIFKAIHKGQISASKADDGTWRIDPSELARVYTPGTTGQQVQEATETDQEPTDTHRELALLRELISRSDAIVADLRSERDAWKDEAGRWQAQAEAQTRLLTHQAQPSTDALAQASQPVQRGLLARLWGRS